MSLVLMGLGGSLVGFGIGDSIILLLEDLPPDVSIAVEPQGRSRESRERSRQLLPEQFTVHASLVAVKDVDVATLTEGRCTKLFEHEDGCSRIGTTLATVTRLDDAYLVEAAYEGSAFAAHIPIARVDDVIVKAGMHSSGSALFIAARKARQ